MAKYFVEADNVWTRWYSDDTMTTLHCEHGPAAESIDGEKGWFIDGLLHRDDGPALERNGDKFWYNNGNRHREDGPAREYANGNKSWWLNGKRHREDGPAIEYRDGSKIWYKNGLLHREDGPAIENVNGSVQYWLNGNKLSKDQWEQALRPEELTVAQIEHLLGKRVKIVK